VKFQWRHWLTITPVNSARRRLLGGLLAGSGLAAVSQSPAVRASDDQLRFPGDPADHKLVYQFNKSDPDYHNAVLFSVGAMLRQWGDNIDLVVVGIGPGIHILLQHPQRPVTDEIRERVTSLAQYGVEFHACGNTLSALGLSQQDVHAFVKVVEVGASDLMELQEQGYAYISW